MDQVITYNRLGVFNPAGMIFALARDVFPVGTDVFTLAKSCRYNSCTSGEVMLRPDKRPRPLTLRVNEGQTIEIKLKNLLSSSAIPDADNSAVPVPPGQSEQPATRNVGIHIHGMQWATGQNDDGSNVGSVNSLAGPGGTWKTYTYFADKEGAYTITSGPNLGGEGGSGAIASGLFGILNVEPSGSTWYRSQMTREEMILAADADNNGILDPGEETDGGHPKIDYNALYPNEFDANPLYPTGHPYANKPILKILAGTEIFHSDLNAIIAGVSDGPATNIYPNRGEPFREFTIAFHDEIKVVQAFPEWFDGSAVSGLNHTLASVKDGFAINYGTGGIGAEIIANRLGVGPMGPCTDCKYEEFFLTSWTVGDPAMIVDVPATISDPTATPEPIVATKAFYPDDPSNVWHGYLNDRTKIRNIHVGTEHHIFHLHAHQWLFASLDDNSNYLDAQALGPGSSFTYEIAYGGGGNRNKTAGDSIFHCHFYPHFAQGMWGLWRVHDTFEIGSKMAEEGTVLERGLLDGEIAGGGYNTDGSAIPGGTPIPGVVPIPNKAMALMPGFDINPLKDTDSDGVPDAPDLTTTVKFQGYPFYIAGVPGHRPPTPPLDLVKDGGLPRHVVTGGTVHAVQTPLNFEKELLTASGVQYPEEGTAEERAAMAFHGPQSTGSPHTHNSYKPDGSAANNATGFEVNGLPPVMGAPYAEPCRNDNGTLASGAANPRTYKASVIELDVQLNKVGWHFNQQRIIVLDGDANATIQGSRAPEPFVMRANSNDCVNFDHTNLVPSVYQQDDFQVKTPTDVIGQHIHLVKFDVMSADGAANGWNYEDGTLSPDEVAERIHAFTAKTGSWDGDKLPKKARPRTTRQRWYIDPVLNEAGEDRGLGNVFTHDHYGPSTHQQAGLYATLLAEPEGSTWRDSETGIAMGSRNDGGPTSWRADIITANPADSYREFYLEFADFQLAYRAGRRGGAVNPPGREEVGLPFILERGCPPPFSPNGPCPEAISAEDPGTFVVNYRNEPIALRVRDPNSNEQAGGEAGDLSHAFRSIPRADSDLNKRPNRWPYGGMAGQLRYDPFTPLLQVYEGDKVSLRVQVGAHEEGHNFSMNGIKWLQSFASPYSGFRNSQMMGISEYFRFEVPAVSRTEGGLPGNKFDDYRYMVGSSVDAIWNGSWGIMRSYERNQDVGLQYLPNNPEGELPGPPPPPDQRACPTDGDGNFLSLRHFSIAAVRAADVLPNGTLEYHPNLDDPTALLYVLTDDIDPDTGLLTGPVEPLILRANAGDCIEITLENRLNGPPLDEDGFNLLPMIVDRFNANQVRPSSHVGLHPQLVEYAVAKDDGMNVGFNEVQTADLGETVTYHWYAGNIWTDSDGNLNFDPMEFGAINLIPADPIKHSNKGLVGALIIEPEGSLWFCDDDGGAGTTDCYDKNAENYPPQTRASATVIYGDESFRDFVVVMQDDINMLYNDSPVPIVSDEEDPEDSGMKAINYRTDPIWLRLGIGPTADPQTTRTVDFTGAFAGNPETPIFEATAGEEVRFRVLKPGGHNRNQVFTLHGHLWARHPFNNGSTAIDPWNFNTFWHGEQMGHGPTNHINVVPLNGAGGNYSIPGDYLYRDMAPVHVYNGIWGIFRVGAP
jgi:hypothetical protein